MGPVRHRDAALRGVISDGPAGDATSGGAPVLRSLSLPVSAALPRRVTELEGISTAVLVQAAVECRDEADSLRRLTARR